MLSEHPADIMLLATDLAAARRFYGDTIGLPIWLETPDFVTFECGGDSRLVVTKSSENSTDLGTKVSWRVDDLEAEVADLRARGVTIDDVPAAGTVDGVADLGFASVAWFSDPAGKAIGLMQMKNPDGRRA